MLTAVRTIACVGTVGLAASPTPLATHHPISYRRRDFSPTTLTVELPQRLLNVRGGSREHDRGWPQSPFPQHRHRPQAWKKAERSSTTATKLGQLEAIPHQVMLTILFARTTRQAEYRCEMVNHQHPSESPSHSLTTRSMSSKALPTALRADFRARWNLRLSG